MYDAYFNMLYIFLFKTTIVSYLFTSAAFYMRKSLKI